jgi:hypothetical protein
MKSYRIANREQTWYGELVGILMLDTSYPCIPGNVGNASPFDLPVRYEKVEGASIDRLLIGRTPRWRNHLPTPPGICSARV